MSDPTSKNAEGVFEPFSASQVPWIYYKGDSGSCYQVLSKFGGGSQVGVGIDIMEPGDWSNRKHYHMLEEEHVFILEGEATLHLGDKQYVMKTGDYCCFPAGQKVGHHLYNHSDKVCRFLTIGDNHPADIRVYPEAGKVKLRLTGETFDISKATR